MVGGGQLARMTHQAAIALGQSLRVLAERADDSAALVTPEVQLGSHLDLAALESFAAQCDVVTFDHEHVPSEHIATLAAAGHLVYPGAQALQYAQDKALMRVRLAGLGAPVPAFTVVDEAAGLMDAATNRGFPFVVKTARGGYDGRGVWVVRDATKLQELTRDLAGSGTLVVEDLVPMRRELAVMVARSPFGQAATWPVVETVQRDGICVQVIAPATELPAQLATAATELALRLAGELGVVGVMAVELFETVDADGSPGLLINELAMRPHNSGHWTMDGAITSQFEQHLRAVLDYPLGRTDAVAPVTVMSNVLGGPAGAPGSGMGMDERVHHLAARFPQVKVHLYGKAFRPGRKLGHVNVIGSDVAELRTVAELSAEFLGSGCWSDGYDPHAGDRPAVRSQADLTGESR